MQKNDLDVMESSDRFLRFLALKQKEKNKIL